MRRIAIVLGVIGMCIAQSVGQSSSPRVLEIKAIERAGNPRISPEVRFDVSMDRKSTEAATRLFIGLYNPNQRLQSFQNLKLYCGSSENLGSGWVVKNPNLFPISFSWISMPSNEKGIGVAPAEGDFLLRLVEKSGKVQINYGKDLKVESSFLPQCNSEIFSDHFGDSFTWFSDDQRNILILRPLFFEDVGTPYTLAISTGAQDKNGRVMTEPAWLTFTPQALGAVWGNLYPGTTLNGPDEVQVAVFNENFRKPIRIYFQKVNLNAMPDIRKSFTPIGNFYRIGSPDKIPWSSDEEQYVSFRLPKNIISSNIAMVYLANSTGNTDNFPPYSYYWNGAGEKGEVVNNRINSTLYDAPDAEGLIYGIGQW
jgi:hypothetical protein